MGVWSFQPGVDPRSGKRRRDLGLPARDMSAFGVRNKRAARDYGSQGVWIGAR